MVFKKGVDMKTALSEAKDQGHRNGKRMENPLEEPYDFQDLADIRSGPGILVMSGESRLLHINRRGWEFIRQMNDAQEVKAGGLLPTVVSQICTDVYHVLKLQNGSKDWEQMEVRRMAGEPNSPILLRGFGLPGGGKSPKSSRVLIIMETVGRRKKAALHAKERFQLTEREQTVVQNLAKGWTNKEIACELGISEPTVKAHIKHIMEKTKCTTRTGIVAQLLQGSTSMGS
jgi:DNA-binding CsgD family transcriptional regulator